MYDVRTQLNHQDPIDRTGSRVGRIDLVELLGRGGMGEVYLGYDEKLDRRVAVKAILGEKRFEVHSRARFLREARILSQLDHPAICRIYEIVEDSRGIFLILEYVEGTDLAEALARDELDDATKLRVAEQIARALAVAHSNGVTHRDLKPGNVMLTFDGDVKVLDFGLARTVETDDSPESTELRLEAIRRIGIEEDLETVILEAEDESEQSDVDLWDTGDTFPLSRTIPLAQQAPSSLEGLLHDDALTEHGAVMGTVRYMSPEQACGLRATASSDMYSFGLLVQEMLTGESAYPKNLGLMQLLHKASLAETNPVAGVDADLKALIEQLKSLSPKTRPTAAAVVERLRFIEGKPKRRLRQILTAVGVVVLLALGFKYTSDLRRERTLAIEARQDAEQLSTFVLKLFETADTDVTAREMLDAGAVRVREQLHDQPLNRAYLMTTMGRIYLQLGLYQDAESLFDEASALLGENLEASDDRTLEARALLIASRKLRAVEVEAQGHSEHVAHPTSPRGQADTGID